ncbi:hypothetical protein GF359_01025 [candidate division WOR-3 bacterium]|uniref:Uncharacterized protein n=1 Tax=candidate division WOR-3 bacterium TaxID=2052148 RepID=A0A9D5QC93_UNCW3|nr:hypothetical protein [candidate division WOR-3 bacterium]MBD3363776.1 hypothetical protein [candidate division WOR-3 bacterium]
MFATDLTDERKTELCAKIAERVIQFKVAPLAIVFLETIKPLSFLGNQLMVFFAPMVTAFTTGDWYDEATAFFEDRSNLEMLIRKIEELESERAVEANRLKEQRKKDRREKRGKRRK